MTDKEREDREDRAKRIHATATSLKASASIPPPARPSESVNGTIEKIERRQVQVVEAIGESLETMSEVVDELQESIEEDERVRMEIASLTVETGRLRRLVRATAYVTMLSTATAAVIVVLATTWQVRMLHAVVEDLGRFAKALRTVEGSAQITTDVILKQAVAGAKEAEATVAPDPQRGRAALEAAIDLQENAAEARLAVAANHDTAPPPAAASALREAREKRAKLRRLAPSAEPIDPSKASPLPSASGSATP